MSDAEILAFRGRLTATILADADTGAAWSFSDAIVRLIDYCNRALGCGMHDGQVWRGAAGLAVTPQNYAPCRESRLIVEGAVETMRRAAG